MGSRHNRKRTRSRPRNRNTIDLRTSHYRTQSYNITPCLSHSAVPSTTSLTSRSANHWHEQYAAWQERLRVQQQQQQQLQQQQQQQQQHESRKQQADALRLRIFGGEAGDADEEAVALCGPMLRVVMDLFEGEVDYVDP